MTYVVAVRVLICPDSFTGTMTAAEASRAMALGWSAARPHDLIVELAVSDGGPGFVSALHHSLGGEVKETPVSDPLGREVTAQWLHSADTAYIESAAACGLLLLDPSERNPLFTSTYGVGLLVDAAIEHVGHRRPVHLGVARHQGAQGHGTQVIGRYLEAKRPLTVGVFADQSFEEINEIVEEAGIDLVQLSGDESWEDCLMIARQTIQVVHVSPLDSPSDPMALVEPGFAVALMLDAAHGPYRGGTGHTFDWEVARLVAGRMPMLLAGGLSPENVADAVRAVRPWAVDVSSGTETDGRKDYDRVRAFVRAVRDADREATR